MLLKKNMSLVLLLTLLTTVITSCNYHNNDHDINHIDTANALPQQIVCIHYDNDNNEPFTLNYDYVEYDVKSSETQTAYFIIELDGERNTLLRSPASNQIYFSDDTLDILLIANKMGFAIMPNTGNDINNVINTDSILSFECSYDWNDFLD